MSRPRVAIVGVGGVGGVVAASLATAGTCELTLLARGSTLERLRRSGGGLRVVCHNGDTVSCQPHAIDVCDAASAGHQDFVIWATKAHQMKASATAVASMVGPQTRVVPLQNGMPWWFFHGYGGKLSGRTLSPADATVHTLVCPSHVIGAMSFVAGEVRQETWLSKWPASKSSLTFGELGQGSTTAVNSVGLLASLFDQHTSRVPLGTNVLGPGDIRRAVFEKVRVNASINTLSTLARLDCGQLTASQSLCDALRRIVAELDAVAASLDPPLHLQTSAQQIIDLYSGQYGLLPSMLQDLYAERPLERQALVSSLVALGTQLGVPVPTLALLDALLEGLDFTEDRIRP